MLDPLKCLVKLQLCFAILNVANSTLFLSFSLKINILEYLAGLSTMDVLA